MSLADNILVEIEEDWEWVTENMGGSYYGIGPFLRPIAADHPLATRYQETLRPALLKILREKTEEYTMSLMSIKIPDRFSPDGLNSHAFILITVVEWNVNDVAEIEEEIEKLQIEKQYIINLATVEYDTFSSMDERPVLQRSAFLPETTFGIREEGEFGYREWSNKRAGLPSQVFGDPPYTWNSFSMGYSVKPSDSTASFAMTCGHAFSRKDNSLARVGTSVYNPSGVDCIEHLDKLRRYRYLSSKDEREFTEEEILLGTGKSLNDNEELNAEDLAKVRAKIEEYYHEETLQTDQDLNDPENDLKFGRLEALRYEVINFEGRKCISDWAVVRIEPNRLPPSTPMSFWNQHLPRSGYLSSIKWKSPTGEIGDLSPGMPVRCHTPNLGRMHGYVGGIMDVRTKIPTLKYDHSAEKVDLEEYFVIGEEWHGLRITDQFARSGSSGAMVLDQEGKAVGQVFGGLGLRLEIRRIFNEMQPHIIDYKKRKYQIHDDEETSECALMQWQVSGLTVVMSMRMLVEQSGIHERT